MVKEGQGKYKSTVKTKTETTNIDFMISLCNVTQRTLEKRLQDI